MTDSGSDPQAALAPSATTAALLPGAALAAARIAQGLSLEDIARQLKLSVAQIKSIEADDHSHLPSPVFVRGFIRTYARVLKLDIALLLPPKVAAAETTDVRLMQDSPRLSMEPNPYRRVPAIVAGIVCVLLILAYYEFVLNAPPTPAPVAVDTPPAPAALVTLPQTALPTAVVADAAAPATGAAAVVAPVETAKPDAKGEPLVLKKSGEPVSAAARGLFFVFNGQSWVEVRDAEGKVVFSRNNAAGSERRVQGEPPFSVVVGGASNVQLTYNGKVVDLAAHATEDVARLQLE